MSDRMDDLRKWSKAGYVTLDGQGPTHKEIDTGSLQRIADAVEKVAVRHDELVRDRDQYKRMWENQRERADSYKRSNAALRGHLRRVKAGATGKAA